MWKVLFKYFAIMLLVIMAVIIFVGAVLTGLNVAVHGIGTFL